MAPKLKGKELAAFKKAEKAQFEEIAMRYQQEMLTKESLEIARKELEAKLAYEAEQAWLKAERERLEEEVESMKPMFKKHHDALSKLEAAALVKKEWELFMDTSGLPQAAKEATVNTYLEVESKTLAVDYNQVLKSLVDMYKTAGEAEALALQEDQKGDAKEAAKYRGFMQKLEKGLDAGWSHSDKKVPEEHTVSSDLKDLLGALGKEEEELRRSTESSHWISLCPQHNTSPHAFRYKRVLPPPYPDCEAL